MQPHVSFPPTILAEACVLKFPCDLREVGGLCLKVREFFAEIGLETAEMDAWELAIAEGTNNAIKYCRPEAQHVDIRVDVLAESHWVEVRISDHTAGFDWPLQAELPPPDSESGRGVFLIQNLTDDARYLRGRGENCLVLRRKRIQPSETPLVPRSTVTRELRDTGHTLELMTEELASSYESLSAIFRFTADLQSGADAGKFIHRWLAELLTITACDWFALRLLDPATSRLRLLASSDAEWSSEAIFLEGGTDLGPCIEANATLRRTDLWFDLHTPLGPDDPLNHLARGGCGFAHPLFVRDTPVGVLSMGRHDAHRPIEAGDVNVIQTFGDFLGLQIRSTHRHEEQVRARLQARELDIAADLQKALLPERLPSLAHVSLRAYYRSAREIGGDYYDAFQVGEGNLLLVVADVMGKGLPAALFAFMFRSLVRAGRHLATQPAEFLAWLNQNLVQELERAEMFITAQIAFLDCEHDELRVASAGHLPMLIAGADGLITEISAGGPPLGIIAGATFPHTCHSCSGGRALMLTDGLIEARNPNGDMLGMEAIKAELTQAALSGESSQATQQRFVRLLMAFEQGAPPADDTAFIVIVASERTQNDSQSPHR
jgi:serine phosphatase RsbU (regulator of sigma subunit)/anti-sigma regulatory factor (Ser/Thr protein kinase)